MTNDGLESRHAVRSELSRRIDMREWTPGTLVPNEGDPAEEFGCARSAVDRAMRERAAAGLVRRERRAGMRVAHHPPSRIALDIPMIQLQVGASRRHAPMEASTRACRAEVATRSGHGTSAPVRHVAHGARLHPRGSPDRPGRLARDRRSHRSFADDWPIQNARRPGGDIGSSAGNARPWIARNRSREPGGALLAADRITWDGAVPVTSARPSRAPGGPT